MNQKKTIYNGPNIHIRRTHRIHADSFSQPDNERRRVIRENVDLGRPETVQLIFARKMRRSTVAAGRCRTRIVTEEVIPSLHVYYKNTHLKQYHKRSRRGAGLRTDHHQ
jgi:hypothetical protein